MTIHTKILEDRNFIKFERTFNPKDKLLQNGICSDVKTYDDYLALDEKHGYKELCLRTVKAFEDFYDVDLGDLDVLSDYTIHESNAGYISGAKKMIHIDPFLIDGLHEFYILCFLWESEMYKIESRDIDFKNEVENSLNSNERFFKYMVASFYAAIVDKKVCDLYSFELVYEAYKKIGQNTIFNLGISCQYCALAFCVAHECAHAYFDIKKQKFASNDNYSADDLEEFEADKMAYKLIIGMIDNEQNLDVKEREMFNYNYMSPMMLMEYYYAYFIIDEKIKNVNNLYLIEKLRERGNHLMKYYYEYFDKYNFPFDTDEGNCAYNGILNAMCKFCDMFKEYNLNGKFNIILEMLKECGRAV